MRHKAAIALGCVVVALALASCGGTPESTPAPTPDIEAVVQARLKEERAADANVEAKAQVLAKAMVKATAQAASVVTPIPPSPTPARTHTATPTAAPIPPTSTATPIPPTPTATPTATPIPPTPTPIPTPTIVNLAPYQPRGWEAPLVVSRNLCSAENIDLSSNEDTYISWAVDYTGPSQIGHISYTDLLFDGVVVARWRGNDLDPSQYSVINKWKGLSQQTRVTAGEHTLSLLVDSTNLVTETNEDDNVFTQCFTWATAEHEPITPQDLSRAPDLVPFAAQGWSNPLVATSYQGAAADGPLSVDVPSNIWYGVQNQGLSSTTEDFWVYLYLDDILVRRSYLDGLLVNVIAGTQAWAELSDVTNVVKGTHTLKMVVDATDLVVESDEGNNVFEKQFTWGSGLVAAMPIETPIPTPIPTPPAPLTLPNLVPGWKFNSDGPIIVSREEGTFLDSLVTADGTFFVDVVVSNRSVVESPPFRVDLYLDGERVNTFERSGSLAGGWLWSWEDWSPQNEQAQMAEGSHTLTMVIDPTDAVQESNEDDNVYEKTVIWSGPGAITEQELTVYTNEELQQMLSGLQAVLDIRDYALRISSTDHTDAVLTVAEAGYYLITGKSLQDERVNIFLSTHDEYLEWIDESYSKRFATSEGSEYPAILARREQLKTEAAGFKARRFGRVAVVVDAERPVAKVIKSLAHELGHMRADLLNPTQVGESYFLEAIGEAQAQQFERTFWLALEDFTGRSLIAYPDFEGFHELIDLRFQTWEAERKSSEHSLGRLLQWLMVLDDPNLSDLRVELVETGRLAAESSLQLYDYLVALAPEVVDSYVSDRLDSLEEWRSTILGISKLRLVPLHELQIEGAADLREPGLMAP